MNMVMALKATCGILLIWLGMNVFNVTAYSESVNGTEYKSNSYVSTDLVHQEAGNAVKEEGTEEKSIVKDLTMLSGSIIGSTGLKDTIFSLPVEILYLEDDTKRPENSQKDTNDNNSDTEKVSISSKTSSTAAGGQAAPEELKEVKELLHLTEEEKLMAATIYGEAAACSETSWEAIANVIMNRVGYREWAKYKTVNDIILYTRFDAARYKNKPFLEAMSYLNSREMNGAQANESLERLIKITLKVYNKETGDITGGAVLYYSPKAQVALNKRYPSRYPIKPRWKFNLLEELTVSGAENDDFKFFRYKAKK